MSSITIASDSSVALKWFHEAGEEEVEQARTLVTEFLEQRIELCILDLTPYEIGNALLRGRAGTTPADVAIVLGALDEICPRVTPTSTVLRDAADLAHEHKLTFYAAAYAAVARERGGMLATMDREIVGAGLGYRPSVVLLRLGDDTQSAPRAGVAPLDDVNNVLGHHT